MSKKIILNNMVRSVVAATVGVVHSVNASNTQAIFSASEETPLVFDETPESVPLETNLLAKKILSFKAHDKAESLKFEGNTNERNIQLLNEDEKVAIYIGQNESLVKANPDQNASINKLKTESAQASKIIETPTAINIGQNESLVKANPDQNASVNKLKTESAQASKIIETPPAINIGQNESLVKANPDQNASVNKLKTENAQSVKKIENSPVALSGQDNHQTIKNNFIELGDNFNQPKVTVEKTPYLTITTTLRKKNDTLLAQSSESSSPKTQDPLLNISAITKAEPDKNIQSKIAATAKAQADKDAQLNVAAKAQDGEDAQVIVAATTKAQADKDAQLNVAAKAQDGEDAQVIVAATTKAQADKDVQSKIAAIAKAQADKEAQLKATAKAKADEEAQLKAAAKAKADEEAQLKAAAKAKADEEAQLKTAAKAKADEEAQLKAAAIAKTKADTEAQLKVTAIANRINEAENQILLSLDSKLKPKTFQPSSSTLQSATNFKTVVKQTNSVRNQVLKFSANSSQLQAFDLKYKYPMSQMAVLPQQIASISLLPIAKVTGGQLQIFKSQRDRELVEEYFSYHPLHAEVFSNYVKRILLLNGGQTRSSTMNEALIDELTYNFSSTPIPSANTQNAQDQYLYITSRLNDIDKSKFWNWVNSIKVQSQINVPSWIRLADVMYSQ